MDKEGIVGAVIMALTCLGCGALFALIGIRAERAEKPVHFWSGIPVAAEKITDVHGYNHANAVMWKWYSVPYFLAGILGAFGVLGDGYIIAAAAVLVAACLPGLFLLIGCYKRIEKHYLKD